MQVGQQDPTATTSTFQALPHKATGDIQGTNFPKDGEGRVYHLVMKVGELANYILIVGDPNRAEIVATNFLKPDPDFPHVFPHRSNRGYVVYTGFFKGRRMSVASTGMGFTLVDFFVREARAIIPKGRIYIIRLGSCGTPNAKIAIGTLVTAKAAYGVFDDTRPFFEIMQAGGKQEYTITNANYPDSKLHAAMKKALEVAGAKHAFPVVDASIAATLYFYSGQGRQDPEFPDDNETLLKDMLAKHPDTGAIEMEVYPLFNLADKNTHVRKEEGISAATCAIVLAQRINDEFLSMDRKHFLEKYAGEAGLEGLLAVDSPSSDAPGSNL